MGKKNTAHSIAVRLIHEGKKKVYADTCLPVCMREFHSTVTVPLLFNGALKEKWLRVAKNERRWRIMTDA